MMPIIGVTSGWESGQLVEGWPVVMTVKNVIERLERAGAVPVVLPIVEDISLHKRLVGMLHGLVATGEIISANRNVFADGTGNILYNSNPLRYRNEESALAAALSVNIPILGICRGYQVLNVMEGGVLADYDITPGSEIVHHQKGVFPPEQTVHEVRIRQDSKLYEALGRETIRVNSFHRQAVLQAPYGYVACATSPDGRIEAIEAEDERWIVGVQFHPEMLQDPIWDLLFRRFVEEAGKAQRR